MSAKRRDSKNRILKDGESQRPDGRYMYRYTDMNGKTQTIYSWRLVATDKVPDGKKDNGALRDRIKEIQKDLFDYVQPNGGGITVLQLVKRYTGLKTGVKESTKSGYRTVIKWLEKDPFGSKTFGEVKTSDAKQWLIYFQHAVEKYNRTYCTKLPRITPHVCRHTYCSNMAKSGMNPKVLQYLMGHSDISVTLNTYTHLRFEDAKEELEKLREAEQEVRPAKNKIRSMKNK